MRRYYLDSNALAYCIGQPHLGGWTPAGAQQLRDAIAKDIRQGSIEVLGSQYHLEEASRIPGNRDPEARQRFFDFFWKTTGWLLLLTTQELAFEEVKANGRLQANEPYDTAQRRMTLKSWCGWPHKLDALGPDVKRFAEQFAADQEARKQRVTAKLAATFKNLTPAQATRRWWRNADTLIEDWVSDYMVNSAALLGLPADKSRWPAPRSLQTAWAMHACLMARIALNVGFGWNVGSGDIHDAHHYASACYADAFVVQDRASRETVKLIPNQPVHVMTFDEFADDLGIKPH